MTKELIVKETGGSYTLVPEGSHLARAYGVVDLGLHRNERYNKDEKKLMILWELLSEQTPEGDPMTINQRYTHSLAEKANLRRDLESWRGRSFTPEELKGFNIFTIINVPCFITVVHNRSGDKTYSNVGSVGALPKGTPCPPLTKDEIAYTSTDPDASVEWEKLEEWIKKMIEPLEGMGNDSTEDVPF